MLSFHWGKTRIYYNGDNSGDAVVIVYKKPRKFKDITGRSHWECRVPAAALVEFSRREQQS